MCCICRAGQQERSRRGTEEVCRSSPLPGEWGRPSQQSLHYTLLSMNWVLNRVSVLQRWKWNTWKEKKKTFRARSAVIRDRVRRMDWMADMCTTFRYGEDAEEQLSSPIRFVTQCPAYRFPHNALACCHCPLSVHPSTSGITSHDTLLQLCPEGIQQKGVYRAQLARCAPAWNPAWQSQYILVQYIKSACVDTARPLPMCTKTCYMNISITLWIQCEEIFIYVKRVTLLRPDISIARAYKKPPQSITIHPKISSGNNQKRGQNRLPGVTAHLNQITRMCNEHVTLGFFHLHKTITPWTVGSMSSRLHASCGVISRRHTRLAIN